MAKLVLTITANNKATQSVKLLNTEIETLSKTLSSVSVNKDLTAQIKALTANYKEMGRVARETIKIETQQIANQARQARAATQTANAITTLQKRFATLLTTIKSLKNAYPQGTFDSIEQSVRANLQAAKDGTKGVDELGKAYNELSRDLAVAKAETEKVTTAVVKSGDSIGSLAKKFLLWQVTATLVMKPLRLISDALTSINETLVKTEDAVIALQRVLPSGSASDSEISSHLYKIAQDYGQTFENVSQIAQNFARTGMSWADTIKATEAAVLALNVAELDATQASDGMIAILTQFGKEASELELIVDELNITADNAAVTTEKLLTALTRTGSSAKNANLTLEQTVGIITALSEATGRSGENLGTAVNSLIQFSTKTKSLDTFANLSDGMKKLVEDYKVGEATVLDIWQGLADEIQNRKGSSEGILGTLFADEDWRTLNEQLQEELGENFATVTEIYDTASTFRKNYFIALLGNLDTVKQTMETMDGAEGYSMLENDEYLDTYTAKLNSLNAQWQDFVNGAQSILTLKKIGVEVASGLLTVVDALDKAHVLLPAVTTAVVALVTAFRKAKFEKQAAEFTQLTNAIVKNKAVTQSEISTIAKLNTRQKRKVVDTLADAAATKKLTAEELKQIIAEGNLTKTVDKLSKKQKQRIAADLNAKVQSGQLTQAEAQQIGTTFGLVTADGALVVANKAAGISFKILGASIKSFLASVPIIGWIMLAVSAITEITSAIAQCCGDAKDKRIENIRETTEEALKLIDALNEATQKLKEANEAVQDSIQSLDLYRKVLNDTTSSEDERADALNNIIAISEELKSQYGIENDYITSLRNGYDDLNGVMDKYLETTKEVAAQKAKEDYETAKSNLAEAKKQLGNAIDNSIGGGEKDKMKDLKEAFDNAGITDYSQFVNDDTIQIGYSEENLELLKEWQTKLENQLEAYGKLAEENPLFKNIKSSDGYLQMAKALSQVRSVVKDMEGTFNDVSQQEQDALKLFANAEILNKSTLANLYYSAMDTTAEAGDAYDELKKKIKESTEYTEEQQKALLSFINTGLKDYVGKYESHLNKWANDITKVVNKYEDLVNVLKKLKDESKEAYDWEEKKLAVLEAQKALEDTRNQATVRRFNEATRQWEWQVDEKAIKDAEKNLKSAQNNLSDEGIDRIIEMLEDETATNDGIKKILDEVTPLLGQSFADAVVKAFKDNVNVDPTRAPKSLLEQAQIYINEKGFKESDRENWTNDEHFAEVWNKLSAEERAQLKGKSYDSGGIANGLGLMVKATDRPESVNDPELTKKILTPRSNQEFETFAKRLGIMFEQAHNFARMPQFERVNNATDNSVNNSGQVFFNGVNIGSDKRDSSLNECLALAGIIPND